MWLMKPQGTLTTFYGDYLTKFGLHSEERRVHLKRLKLKLELFLVGFPYGLLGKIHSVEDGNGKYTLWDRIRYKFLVGYWL